MIILQYNKNGFPLYWIDENPMHGYCIMHRVDKNTSELIRTIPARFRKIFNENKPVF